MGGEGATPYEVLLHAAMVGDATRFTRQDGVDQTWRIMQPLLDAPPPVHVYEPGSWGPAEADGLVEGSQPLARALARVVSSATQAESQQRQSAAAPSPFTPIAEYAFLSNCHTGALVAPDGAIDWLCVPSFDAPSVFGSLLDREAGFFRFAPFDINHPAARHYEPGTNVLITTWKTPSGWVVVRDALTMGPREGEDTITPHTRPPADDDADHLLVRTVECLEGSVEIELVCEPIFDYGRAPAEWTLVDGSRHAADAKGADQVVRLQSDLALGIEGNRVRARHTLEAGDRAYCALSWAEELAAPGDVADADARIAATVRFWRRWLGRARLPDHMWRDPIQRSALAIKGLTYMPTGATVAALTTSLPETPGGERNWDYRYTWMRDTTFTLQALHYLNLDWEADEFMQFVADIEANEDGALQIMYGIDGRRDLTESTLDHLSGLRGRASGADRKRRIRPASERCIRLRAGLRAAAHASERPCPATALADRAGAGRMRDGGVEEPGPGDLGGTRRAAALRLLEAHVLGRARPSGEARRDPWRRRAAGDVGRDGRGDPGRHPRARRERPGRPSSALRNRLPRRLDAPGGDLRLPPGRRRAPARHRARDRGRSHRGRLRAPLPDGGDRRRPLGRGGHVPHLLLLARVGARHRR